MSPFFHSWNSLNLEDVSFHTKRVCLQISDNIGTSDIWKSRWSKVSHCGKSICLNSIHRNLGASICFLVPVIHSCLKTTALLQSTIDTQKYFTVNITFDFITKVGQHFSIAQHFAVRTWFFWLRIASPYTNPCSSTILPNNFGLSLRDIKSAAAGARAFAVVASPSQNLPWWGYIFLILLQGNL